MFKDFSKRFKDFVKSEDNFGKHARGRIGVKDN